MQVMAGDEGFEPPMAEPESAALPLGQSPVSCFVSLRWQNSFYLFSCKQLMATALPPPNDGWPIPIVVSRESTVTSVIIPK
jgi:hypothetical protein